LGDSLDLVSVDAIELAILELRGQRVLLDADLARMYAVETRSLLCRRRTARHELAAVAEMGAPVRGTIAERLRPQARRDAPS